MNHAIPNIGVAKSATEIHCSDGNSYGETNHNSSIGNVTTCWSGYEFPDGSYSIGRVPQEKKGRREKDYDQDLSGKYEIVEWDTRSPTSYLGWESHSARRLREERVAEFERSLRQPPSPMPEPSKYKILASEKVKLGLTPCERERKWVAVRQQIIEGYQAARTKLDPPQELSQDSSGKTKRYGQNGISPNGKRKVKSAATLLERKYGSENLTFGTITLPSEEGGVDKVELYHLGKNWGEFKRRVLQEIKRELERQNAPTELIAVTEIQEKRYERLGEVAPHIHFVCCGRPQNIKDKSDYYLQADRLRQIVKGVLEAMLEKGDGEINVNNTVNLQKVKKSAANYLSKYMSKGGQILEKLKEDGLENCIPNQWWSSVGGMKEWVAKNIRKISPDTANFLMTANYGDDGIIDRKQIAIEIEEGYELVVGVWLKLSRELYEMLSGIPWDEPLSYP